MSTLMNAEVRTQLDHEGNLRLGLEMSPIGPLRPDEILVRIDAAPLNHRPRYCCWDQLIRPPCEKLVRPAASNLGQMLNRLCIADGIPLVNIVRSAEQVDLLRWQGALHVLDSNTEDFPVALVDALAATGATLAFDAIGGGRMAGGILTAMETVALRRVEGYSRRGSRVHKQVYIYGVLDTGPRILEGNFGTAWSVVGWLMTWFYDSLVPADVTRLRARAASGLPTTFVSNYSAEVGLAELLTVDAIKAYTRKATGTKFLVLPQKDMP